jgi:hypothetical protein
MTAQWGLDDWAAIQGDGWESLVAGNGLSIAVSPTFAYTSLYNVAGLTVAEEQIFTALGTQNFELVLDYLRIARVVCQQLHGGGPAVTQQYTAIRTKLVAAVNAHHVDWAAVPNADLTRICTALQHHRNVWTTSYDLIIYWAMMSHPSPTQAFADAFWNNPFDSADAEPNNQNATRVWWPHGALHLHRLPDGSTEKQQHRPGSPLLSLLNTPYKGSDLPLFVSEGTAADKLRAIRGSDYLNYAYTELAKSSGPLVVFGQRLDAQFEQHIIDAINRHPHRTIAYGVWATNQPDANFEVARIQQLFPQANLRFYDSSTHPLS